jgi:hypothetical protein
VELEDQHHRTTIQEVGEVDLVVPMELGNQEELIVVEVLDQLLVEVELEGEALQPELLVVLELEEQHKMGQVVDLFPVAMDHMVLGEVEQQMSILKAGLVVME